MTLSKQQRAVVCNRVIAVIAKHGRRFFSQDADQPPLENPRISSFDIDQRGKIWFTDRWTGKRIYVAYTGRWRGFSEGGTLRSLVTAMAAWIAGKREDFPIDRFGPWPVWICGGDPWGYGGAMETVRREVAAIVSEFAQRKEPHNGAPKPVEPEGC